MKGSRQKWGRALLCLSMVAMLAHSVTAMAAAQSVTISLRRGTLDNVLRQLSEQADVQIVYNTEVARGVQLDNFEVRGQSVEQALTKALAGTNLRYEVNQGVYMLREQQAPAPTRSITGRVVDESGNPIVGASVVIVGSRRGVSTDAGGNFALSHTGAGNVRLDISFMGKQTSRVTWLGSTLSVTLVESAIETGAVVVTGIFDKPKESYTGAATLLTAEQLDQAGTGSLISRINLLEPAFHITENNLTGSDPNAVNMNITMRGSTSINVGLVQDGVRDQTKSNLPLFILDEFEVELQTVLDLDPTQVESVTILKDAAATALYGSRGANGIVVITKKPPIKGMVTLTYKGDLNVNAPDLTSYDLLNAGEKLEYERAVGLYTSDNIAQQAGMDAIYSRNRAEIERGVNTYWLKFPVRVGVGHSHSLRVEGGDDNMLYTASVRANNEIGVMKGSRKTGLGGNVNLIYNYKNLRIADELGVSHSEGNNSPYGQFKTWVELNPYWAPYDDEGFVVKNLNGGIPVNDNNNNVNIKGNPLFDARLPWLSRNKKDDYYNNFAMSWRPIEGLQFKANFTLRRNITTTDEFRDARHSKFVNTSTADYARRGSYDFGYNETSASYEGHLSASYSKVFAQRHQLFAGLQFNMAQNRGLGLNIGAEGFTPSELVSLGMASAYTKDGRPSAYDAYVRSAGLTFSANYTFDGRYYFDLSGKMDGNSQFGANRQTAPFWSAGAGWNLHNEKFMQNASWLSRLRLKASYGSSGSQNFSPFQARTTFISFFGYLYNNMWEGVDMMALGNPDLEWQITREFNTGVDVSLFQDRWTIVADVYNKITDGILLDVNTPLSSGFGSFKANLGKVRNQGFEFSTTVALVRNREKRFSWMATAAVLANRNKVLNITDGVQDLNEAIGRDQKYAKSPTELVMEGKSLNTLYVVKSLGIDPSTGQEIFENIDGTRTFNWDPRQRQEFGSSDSKFWGNLGTLVRYKGVALNLAFSYRWGGKTYNETLVNRVENVNPRLNVDRRVYEGRWKEPGDIARFKSLKVYNSDTNASSRFIMNDNTLECRLIDLSYEADRQWLEKTLRLKYLKVGVLTQNPFRFSTIKQERGIDYPFARTYSLSLTARF